MKIKYTKIYLVAHGMNIHSEHRVTIRRGMMKPATCQFSGARADENYEPMGTLVLTEELWQEWYGKYERTEFITGMETAQSAAEKLVNECPWIHYGCPLCQMRWGPGGLEAAQKHAADEMQQMLNLFEVEDV